MKKDDYWLSRRPKYDVGEIFRIALHYVLKLKPYEAFKCLRLAAAQGHEEAIFLNRHFETYGATPAPGVGINLYVFYRTTFERNPDPRALKYAMWFMEPYERNGTLLWMLADEGEAMAQYMLARRCKRLKDIDGAIRWHRKAAEQNFAPSAYKLSRLSRISKCDTSESNALLLRAAQLGHERAMLVLCGPLQPPSKLRIRVEVRLILSTNSTIVGILEGIVKYANARLKKEGIGKVFVIGQEFDDYIKYYPELSDKMSTVVQSSVKIYQQMTSRVRQVAVQAILILRSLGVCRDVAVLIAKLVYASRSGEDWYIDVDQK